MDLRDEVVKEGCDDEAEYMDVWARISVTYALRVAGMRREFYKIAAKDPAYKRMLMPTLQKRNEFPAVDDWNEALDQLDSHSMTQFMKAIADLNASNTKTRSHNKDSAADGDLSSRLWKPTLVKRAISCLKLALYGLFGLPIPGNPIRDIGLSSRSVHTGGERYCRISFSLSRT